MKLLVVARHGQYDHALRLSTFGRQQIEALAEALKARINGQQKVVLLTSAAPRALDSAQVLAEELGIEPEEHQVLWSDNGHIHESDDAAVELISGHSDSDVVVVMTHLEYSSSLPGSYAKRAFGSSNGFAYHATSYGEAWVLDCETRTFDHVENGL